MSARIIRLAALALALVATAVAQEKKPAADAPARRSGQAVTGAVLVDHDYRFRLDVPRLGWVPLGEQEIQKLVPSAVAGIRLSTLKNQVWGSVLVEHLGTMKVEDYASLIIEGMAVEKKKVFERKSTRFADRQAVRFGLTGVVKGVRAQFLCVVVRRGAWIYQIQAWGVEGDFRAEDLESVLESFSFLPGEARYRTRAGQRDTHGVDWRFVGGVFESAAYRVRVEAGDGWRPVVGDAVDDLNASAEVGMVHGATGSHLLLFAERVAPGMTRSLKRQYLADLEAMSAGAPGPSRTLELAGAKREFLVREPHAKEPFRLLQANWVQDGVSYRVLTWHPGAAGQGAIDALPAGLARIRILDAAEAERVGAAIRCLADPESDVGVDFSLRGGTYRHYGFGIEWSKPAGGYWTVKCGQEARRINPNAVMFLTEKSSGLFGMLVPERVAGLSGDRFHGLIVNRLRMALEGGKHEAAEPVDIEGVKARVSRLTGRTKGLDLRYRVATFAADGICCQLLLWCLGKEAGPADVLMERAIETLRYRGSKLKPTEIVDSRFVDHRLGWSFPLGGDGKAPENLMPDAARARGSTHQFMGGGDRFTLVVAVDVASRDFDTKVTEGLMLDALRAKLTSDIDAYDAVPFEGRLAGRKVFGKRLTVAGKPLEMRFLQVFSIQYTVVTWGSGEDATELAGEFRLLDD